MKLNSRILLLAHMVYLQPKHNSFISCIHRIFDTYTQINRIKWRRNPLLISPLLTWNPSLCVVLSCPPWSQVTRELASPFLFPPHSKFPSPQGFPSLIVRPTKTTWSRLRIIRNSNAMKKKFRFICLPQRTCIERSLCLCCCRPKQLQNGQFCSNFTCRLPLPIPSLSMVNVDSRDFRGCSLSRSVGERLK
jgi:hypothetical protein